MHGSSLRNARAGQGAPFSSDSFESNPFIQARVQIRAQQQESPFGFLLCGSPPQSSALLCRPAGHHTCLSKSGYRKARILDWTGGAIRNR